MLSIDLNCDMGESFGAYSLGQDEALMDYVSSVNIACGFHAGDPAVMNRTVRMAAKKNLAIGAHPGYADLQGFGRREIKLSLEEAYDIMVYQIGALNAFAQTAGTRLTHVKPHGSLYNAAAKDAALAEVLARAVRDIDDKLIFVGLSGSAMIHEAKKCGLKAMSEVFADRTYQEDGKLTPRNASNALIENPQHAAQQVLQMVQRGTVTTITGKEIPVIAETVCIHGDSKHALDFARAIVNILKQHHVSIKHP